MALKKYRATWTQQEIHTAEYWANDEVNALEIAEDGIPEWAEWEIQPARLEKLEEITPKAEGGEDVS